MEHITDSGLRDLDAAIAQARRAGVAVDVVIGGGPHALSPEIDLVAFRIVREALSNVAEHAGTPRARLVIDYRATEIAIEVLDRGVGCTADAVASGQTLTSLRRHVVRLGGVLSAAPATPRGFRVAARLPFTGANQPR